MSITKEQIRDIIFDLIPDYPKIENEDINIIEKSIRHLKYFGEDSEASFRALLIEHMGYLKYWNQNQLSAKFEESHRRTLGDAEYNRLKKAGWFFSYVTVPRILLEHKYREGHSEYWVPVIRDDYGM